MKNRSTNSLKAMKVKNRLHVSKAKTRKKAGMDQLWTKQK